MKAIAEGRDVKASSGAVSHLVRYAEGGLIDDWAVGEVALFDTNEWRRPANELAIVQRKAQVKWKRNSHRMRTVSARQNPYQSRKPEIESGA